MKPIEYLPIYFKTEDIRINAFLQKNRLHHDLMGNPLCRSARPISVAVRGNGKIRCALMVLLGVAIYLFLAMHAWGWL